MLPIVAKLPIDVEIILTLFRCLMINCLDKRVKKPRKTQ